MWLGMVGFGVLVGGLGSGGLRLWFWGSVFGFIGLENPAIRASGGWDSGPLLGLRIVKP